MGKKRTESVSLPAVIGVSSYDEALSGISELLDQARRAAARSVNGILAATYWEVGRRVVEFEQGGRARAEYGEGLVKRLSADLTAKHGRGFSERNLRQMRTFYQGWEIRQTPSAVFEARVRGSLFADQPGPEKSQAAPAQPLPAPAQSLAVFPLPWSHYTRLLAVEDVDARAFYEAEAIRGGWSVRQLDRQVSSQFYERTAHSKRKAAMLEKGQVARPEDAVSARDEIRDPYLLEFLDLKDEYSEGELEEALVRHLEWFLLELGAGFTFVARQKRIRIGDSWYRIDLVFFHRGLRCLVLCDLKTGKFTHADAGQMNLYLNYAKEHLAMPGEADPVGLILCSDKDDAVVHYAMGGIQAQVFASKYLAKLPPEEEVRRELLATKLALESRRGGPTEELTGEGKHGPTRVKKGRKRSRG
jgi:predicted nuclease of restriction endonuclease-like (RecB) superfamily